MRHPPKTTLGRNDACWCGSGEKYKRCHLNREAESPLPWGQLANLHRQPFLKKKTCLHPDAPKACGKIIRAHTIQRAGIMRDLVGQDRHVLTFHPLDPTEQRPTVHRVGWREASTFLGFCDVHDATLFAPVEQEPFVSNVRQVALLGYRALCHELYQKQAAGEAHATLEKNLDRGLQQEDQRFVQEMLAVQAAGRRAGLEDLHFVKGLYDEAFRTNDCTAFHSAILTFCGTPIIASTGSVHVDFDLQGRRLQNIARDPAPIHGLNFAIAKIADGCACVATWPAQFHKCDTFFASLLQHKEDRIPSLLMEFCFAYVENTYFSATWWKNLPSPNQRHIEHLAGIQVQYGQPLQQSGLRHTTLELTNVTLSHPEI